MSHWVHINGSVRYDTISINEPATEPEFNTCSFRDELEVWDKCNVPCGSEGSIQVSKLDVYRTPTQAFVTYGFSGDLRDYDISKADELETWINSLVPDDMSIWIRQGIFQVEFEGEDLRVYIYDDDLKTFELTKG